MKGFSLACWFWAAIPQMKWSNINGYYLLLTFEPWSKITTKKNRVLGQAHCRDRWQSIAKSNHLKYSWSLTESPTISLNLAMGFGFPSLQRSASRVSWQTLHLHCYNDDLYMSRATSLLFRRGEYGIPEYRNTL